MAKKQALEEEISALSAVLDSVRPLLPVRAFPLQHWECVLIKHFLPSVCIARSQHADHIDNL